MSLSLKKELQTMKALPQMAAVFVMFALTAGLAPASPMQRATVTGTASYRERIALPPNAVFEATLEDVSRADAAAVEIGRSRVERPGQPPIRFSIPYDRAQIKAEGMYSVRTRVLVDGKLMFTSTQPYPVLSRGGGNTVAVTMQRASNALEGMFRYMADAALFTDCQSGQRWPVAMEAEYKSLESAYVQTRKQPGEELKVELQGQFAMRPKADGGGEALTLVVEGYRGIWPGEMCDAPGPTPPLQETYWKLTRLSGKPVPVADGQKEPSLVFRTVDNRFAGSTGCNNLTGTYRLNGDALSLSAIAVTKMACPQGMDLDAALFQALGTVSKWKITGQHLDLLDASNAIVARFEPRMR
jgi:uncharacterized lipoprotein YbaY/heat shock protein HslJ